MADTTAGTAKRPLSPRDQIIQRFGMCIPGPLPNQAAPRAAMDTSQVWEPGTTLGVVFTNGEDLYRQKVRQYAPLWSQACSITFAFDNPPSQDITINFDPIDGRYGLFNSQMGRSSQEVSPSMNLVFDPNVLSSLSGSAEETEKYFRKYILHEFGHSLGLIHEHQSPARNFQWNERAVIDWFQQYAGWNETMTRQQVIDPYQGGPISNTAFDPKSIMLYPIAPGLASDGLVTDWNTELSDLDKFLVGLFYPSHETTLSLGQSVDGSIDKPGGTATYGFTAQDAGTYVIETTGDSAIQMYLFGPNIRGKFVTEDHGKGVDLNAKITTPLQPGAYYLQVRNQVTTDTGPFGISVKKA